MAPYLLARLDRAALFLWLLLYPHKNYNIAWTYSVVRYLRVIVKIIDERAHFVLCRCHKLSSLIMYSVTRV